MLRNSGGDKLQDLLIFVFYLFNFFCHSSCFDGVLPYLFQASHTVKLKTFQYVTNQTFGWWIVISDLQVCLCRLVYFGCHWYIYRT